MCFDEKAKKLEKNTENTVKHTRPVIFNFINNSYVGFIFLKGLFGHKFWDFLKNSKTLFYLIKKIFKC